jgi:pimeloyl-ACP methyl ester carboxylesterase
MFDDMTTLQLEHGELRFSAIEHGTGPLVLCLHGFPDSARSFRLQLEPLAAAGYRVVAPAMRGYEPSSLPDDGDYSMPTIASDVVAWLDQLGVERCHLVGHDWGAIVSYMVASLAPERLHSLTTLAVPHPARMLSDMPVKRPSQILRSWYMLFFQLRGLSDYLLERNDWALLDRLWRMWSPTYELPEDERRALKDAFTAPGVKAGALGYYRKLLRLWFNKSSSEPLSRKILAPTLALTGALDGCMDTRLHDDLMRPSDYPAGLSIERVADAGHFLHQERPAEVNRLLIEHFGRSQLLAELLPSAAAELEEAAESA